VAKRVFRAVLIERVRVTKALNPLAALDEALDAGRSLIFFPEGTRSTDDDAALHAFKPGLYHLARRRPQVELVPVWLENLNRILPKGELLMVPLMAAVTFGGAIALEAGESKEDFLRRAADALRALEN
jgi:1-acyl-sn-glycerol-3-phosphate acyltransferase